MRLCWLMVLVLVGCSDNPGDSPLRSAPAANCNDPGLRDCPQPVKPKRQRAPLGDWNN